MRVAVLFHERERDIDPALHLVHNSAQVYINLLLFLWSSTRARSRSTKATA